MQIKLEGIGHLLGDGFLEVPVYQRAYAWEEQNVLDLVDDVRGALGEGQSEYFLGAVVLSETVSGTVEVVDGQQRLATTALLIASIRDWFHDFGDEERAADIDRDLLVVRDRRTQEKRPRLKLSTADHEFFLRRVLLRENPEIERPSHGRISEALAKARRRVDQVAVGAPKATEALLNWLDYLETGAKVITVRVPSHANAFVVFETLNDRGLSLSAADLLKNHLFMLADDRLKEVQDNWMRTLGALEAASEDGLSSTSSG